MSRLFEPWSLGQLSLPNRIVIAPMCQYSAHDGTPGDWHRVHLGHLALSGAGLLILEATAISPEGRISPQDLGLYSDANEAALADLVRMIRSFAPIALALQLSHAGRKGSSRAPWDGGTQIPAGAPGGWRAEAPSALPHAAGEEAPAALNAAGLARVKQGFVDAAVRAQRAGLQGIELHAAHGYLLHQFLSPLANAREDAYGGSPANRMRFPLEVFDAVKAAVSVPVWVRVSATDWVDGGWDLAQTVDFGRELARRGCAALHVSSGGVSPAQKIPLGPGYQLPLARAVREAVPLPVIGVGLITEPAQAEAAIASGDADAVALARAMLYDPRWPWHAAAALGAQVTAPPPYWRSAPREAKGLFAGMHFGQR
ncbi:NADH:flavin oxidoreductase/NADH oxidase [Rubrivivax albus]|uniref:NADH:flavin oxidoreductase/NADH oxidase n=1 Tax=Rubrivivax albus TaxID=2499835 RepID=A0A437JUS5_9BURK|nr:NADH:flavin oxidoreductase/NADH oxidase [Rubrivivax albus]RVT50972.1 NADH:flavin oxidoreductase/NADH oxidase [Rubrivivax albus]